jgi:DNA-binding NtrC family response regulator
VIERGLSLMGNTQVLEPSLLGLEPPPREAGGPPMAWAAFGPEGFREAKERLISAWERDYVTQLLKKTGGNVSQAAREGGIDRVYLHRLMKKHGIGSDDS